MILNPSHEITFSGLPSDILDAYIRYKKGTRAIVAWIVQFGPSKYHGAKRLPLKQLVSLAASLSGVLNELPEVIHFHFRETIAARKRLSKYFRGTTNEDNDECDTVNHEYFTNSLTQIYDDLCSCCDKFKSASVPTAGLQIQKPVLGNVHNHYSKLPVEQTPELHLTSMNNKGPEPYSKCLTEKIPSFSCDTDLADDELGISIELATILQDMLAIFDAISICWAAAGKAEVHFAAAAFITNVAMSKLSLLESNLRELDPNTSLDDLRNRCCAPVPLPNEASLQIPIWHQLLDDLTESRKAYDHFSKSHQLTTVSVLPSCIQRPADYVQKVNEAAYHATENRLSQALLDNINHLVLSETTPCSIISSSTPVCANTGYFLAKSGPDKASMRMLLELRMLNLSYTKYLDNSVPMKVSECRLATLRLAQQAAKSLGIILKDTACFPCRCPQTLAFHFQALENDLCSYAKYKCWDLYFQSPWVAGNHLLEILDVCHYYGTKLLVYRHYIGAVVHTYNVLRQLAGLEKISLLEHICEHFKETFFPGGQRPSANFRASWTRYVGARLKFKKGHKSHDHRDSWCMAVPAYAARRAAGLGVGEDQKREGADRLLLQIKQQHYHLTENQCGLLSRSNFSLKSHSRPSQNRMSAAIGVAALLPSVDRLLTSTSVDGPSIRLDHFSVFASCVRIVSSISEVTHKGQKENGMNCICFVNAVLSGADRVMDARKLGTGEGSCWKKSEREVVLDMVMKALREELSEKEVKEWSWEI